MKLNDELAQGWKIIAAAIVGIACAASSFPGYAIGAFVKPLEAEFGWTRTEVLAATFFCMTVGGLAAPFIGHLIERYGSRRVAIPSLAGVGVGFAMAAATSSLWSLYLSFAAIALLGAGTTPVTWSRAIVGQFDKRRGFALALALSGTGLSAIVAPLYCVVLIEQFGWRAAFVGAGLLPLMVTLPLVYFHFHPRDFVVRSEAGTGAAAHGLSVAQALRSYRFWVLLFSIAALFQAITGLITNLIPSLTDRGFTAEAAAFAQSAFGAALIGGRIAVGWLIDRYWAPGVAAAVLSAPAAACAIFISDASFAAVVFASALAGLAAGAELDLLGFFIARYFGLHSYSRIYALHYAMLAIAAGTAPMVFSHLYGLTASYDLSFTVAGALFAAGGLSLLALGRYPVFRPALP